MAHLHTTHTKASNQVRRGDLPKVNEYSAELRYRAFRPRHVLGMTNAYAILDEIHTFGVSADAKLQALCRRP